MPEFTVDSWTVSPERNTVTNEGIERRLEPRVMDLLVYLAKHAGQVVGRECIIEAVWPHAFVSDSTLQSAISTLRKALNDNPRDPSILETIPKRGYRLIARSTAAKPVVAVLPFENLTGSAERQYLADGLTDALIAELGRHSALDVISRQSAMAFRGASVPLPQIAEKLNATAVVEGSVLPGRDPVTVTVQLVDATTDTHIWSEKLRLDAGQIFEQQRSVAAEIAWQLRSAESLPESARSSAKLDPEALNHYLLGRFHWYKLDPRQFPAALDNFKKAIAIEPSFSAAYAGIADVWGATGYWGVRSAADVRDAIKESVQTALELDPSGAEANMLAGAYHFHIAHDWPAARSRFEKAVAYNPSLSHARLLFGLFLGTLAEPGARTQFDKARQLDPLNPATWMASAMYAASEDRTDDGMRHLDRALELNPAFPPAQELRADLAWRGGSREAIVLERVLWRSNEDVSRKLSDGTDVGQEIGNQIGDQVSDKVGDKNRLKAAGGALESGSTDAYVSPRVIARLYSLASETDRAIDVLSRAIDAADLMQPDLVTLMPAFEHTRRHPRFDALRQRLGLPQALS